VLFRLDDNRYALPLEIVERAVRAAKVTPLPLAPAVVLGALDVEGDVIPVFDLRRRFQLPERPLHPAQQFVLASAAGRRVALRVDATLGVIERPLSEIAAATRVVPTAEHFIGLIRLEDGLVLIQDLTRFLSAEEGRDLDRALSTEADGE
jgi:purine-binding chemotaxis protein CheW